MRALPPLLLTLPFSFTLALGCNNQLRGIEIEDDGGLVDVDGGPCAGLRCQIPSCPAGGRTTISGVVNIPAGNLPLFGATVYVPGGPVAPLQSGASCDRCEDTPSGDPVSKGTSDIRGRFTLSEVPAGRDIPLVIKAGKWRRQVVLSEVRPCQDNPVDAELTRLPRRQSEGDIPRIALSTGGADAIECLLRKLGIADEEFTTESGKGRVNLYAGEGGTNKFVRTLNGGAAFTASAKVPAASWWDNPDNLLKYDVVVLSCEGNQNLPFKSTAARANVQRYINQGGRVFASHWHNAWLQHAPAPLSSVAKWTDAGAGELGTINARIDAPQNQPSDKRNALADWLMNVGGSTQRGVLNIQNAKSTVKSIDAALTERWVYYQPGANTNHVQYFQFNAPVGADPKSQCGRMVFSDIHVTGAADGDVSSPNAAFPSGCVTSALTPQEKALIFMLFDLSNCLSPILG